MPLRRIQGEPEKRLKAERQHVIQQQQGNESTRLKGLRGGNLQNRRRADGVDHQVRRPIQRQRGGYVSVLVPTLCVGTGSFRRSASERATQSVQQQCVPTRSVGTRVGAGCCTLTLIAVRMVLEPLPGRRHDRVDVGVAGRPA